MAPLLSPEIARRGEVFSQGSSAQARRLRSSIQRLAATRGTTILVEGERGTWRTAHAAWVHARSGRATEPLACLPATTTRHFAEELVDGLRLAGRGTLVVEDVQELDPRAQALLASVLERRSWGPDEHPLEGRVIATASTDFDRAIDEGRVHGELAYRLNVLRLHVPPLRDRREDVAVLVELLGHLEHAPRPARRLAHELLERWSRESWPGNLRELEARVLGHGFATETAESTAVELESIPGLILPNGTLKAREESWIRSVLAAENGNRSRAARVLGIHRATLYNKLKEYGIHAD